MWCMPGGGEQCSDMLPGMFVDGDLRFEALLQSLVCHVRGRLNVHVSGSEDFGRDGSGSRPQEFCELDEQCTRTTRWILQILRRMVERKWGMSIDERDEDGGAEQDLLGEKLMTLFNKCQITTLCIDLIAVGTSQPPLTSLTHC